MRRGKETVFPRFRKLEHSLEHSSSGLEQATYSEFPTQYAVQYTLSNHHRNVSTEKEGGKLRKGKGTGIERTKERVQLTSM